MWFTPDGDPLGFYHETAPAELKDQFIANLDPLFYAGEELSAWTLTDPSGPAIGKMLAPGMQERFRLGNIHRFLCEPLGHGELIDLAANGGEAGRAGLTTWHKAGTPMTREHAERLGPIQPMIERALREMRADVRWRTVSRGAPHFLFRAGDLGLVAIDPEAERILRNSHLLRQNFSITANLEKAPSFVGPLVVQLAGGDHAELALPVLDGRVLCRAAHTRVLAPQANAENLILVTLELQVAEVVAQIDYVMSLKLTPLQREIAIFGLQGNDRSTCLNRFQVSNEALKKHVRAVLKETRCERFEDLHRLGVPEPAAEVI